MSLRELIGLLYRLGKGDPTARWRIGYVVRRLLGMEIVGALPYEWSKIAFNRTDVIVALAENMRAASYLEIGCNDDVNFDQIPVARKIGVDPARGGTHRMTSDDFFASNLQQFDLIFVDGLHTYEQVKKDIWNSLNCLSPCGAVVVHDMLPPNWRIQHVPRISYLWTGDVWKAAFEFSLVDGIDVRVVVADYGVGVITKGNRYGKIDLGGFNPGTADFRFFLDNYEKLNLIGFDEFRSQIAGD